MKHGAARSLLPNLGYGRIHYTKAQIERIATLKVATRMQEAEHTYTIPHQLPGGRENVLGGRQPPAAAAPPNLRAAQGVPPKSVDRVGEGGGDQWMGSDERSSMADLYQVRFGDYFVAMNTTVESTYRERTLTLDVPFGPGEALDLVSGERLDITQPVQLGPRSTVVLYRSVGGGPKSGWPGFVGGSSRPCHVPFGAGYPIVCALGGGGRRGGQSVASTARGVDRAVPKVRRGWRRRPGRCPGWRSAAVPVSA